MASISGESFLQGKPASVLFPAGIPKVTVTPPKLPETGLGEKTEQRISNIGEAFRQLTEAEGMKEKVQEGIGAAGVGIGETAGVAFDAFEAGLKKTGLDKLFAGGLETFKAAGEKITPDIILDKAAEFGQSKEGLEIKEALNKGVIGLNRLMIKNPNAVDLLKGLVNFGLLVAGTKTAKPVVQGAKTGIEAIPVAVETIGTKGGAALKTAGEKITQIAVTPSEATTKAMKSYQASGPTMWERVKGLLGGEVKPQTGTKPTTEADTAVRLLSPGTEWSQAVGAERAAGKLWNETIAPALDQSMGRTNMKSFFDEVEQDIIKENADLTRRNSLLKALNAIKEDFGNVRVDVSDARLQAYKEGWTKFLPEKAFKGEPIAGAVNEVRSVMAGKAREIIASNLGPEVKQAYFDYGNLRSLSDEANKMLKDLKKTSFTKNMWETIVEKAVTPVFTGAGKAVYKTGEGFEWIGDVGAKKIRDFIETPKAGMMIESVFEKEGSELLRNNYSKELSGLYSELVKSEPQVQKKILEEMKKVIKEK